MYQFLSAIFLYYLLKTGLWAIADHYSTLMNCSECVTNQYYVIKSMHYNKITYHIIGRLINIWNHIRSIICKWRRWTLIFKWRFASSVCWYSYWLWLWCVCWHLWEICRRPWILNHRTKVFFSALCSWRWTNIECYFWFTSGTLIKANIWVTTILLSFHYSYLIY